ncbi:MAG: DUF192 domain-containing protein [Planctomycetota bacterium]|nr:DUF192 domain-containing protein [Planctomycetota bacterium]
MKRTLLLTLFLTSLWLACEKGGKTSPAPGAGDLPSTTRLKALTTHGKSVTLIAELALTESQRRRGLMHRNHLDTDRGMLFIYPEARLLSMWMKNCRIPLSLAYLSDSGQIIQIVRMRVEPTGSTHFPSYPAKESCAMALEMSWGWFERKGIKVGDQILIPQNIRNLSRY